MIVAPLEYVGCHLRVEHTGIIFRGTYKEEYPTTLSNFCPAVGCWVDILEGRVSPESCYLEMTDSSCCCGWICKSNFQSIDQLFHCAIAELLTTLFMEAQSIIIPNTSKGFGMSSQTVCLAISIYQIINSPSYLNISFPLRFQRTFSSVCFCQQLSLG